MGFSFRSQERTQACMPLASFFCQDLCKALASFIQELGGSDLGAADFLIFVDSCWRGVWLDWFRRLATSCEDLLPKIVQSGFAPRGTPSVSDSLRGESYIFGRYVFS